MVVKRLARLGRGDPQEVSLVVALLERRDHRHESVLVGDQFRIQVSISEFIEPLNLVYFQCVLVLSFLVDGVCNSLLTDVLHLDHSQTFFGDQPFGFLLEKLLEALLAAKDDVEAALALVGDNIHLRFVVYHLVEVSELQRQMIIVLENGHGSF